MTNWHYYNASGERIAVTSGQLKELANQGVITPNTMVETKEGKTAPARRVKGLAFAETMQAEVMKTAEAKNNGLSAPSLPAEPNPFSVIPPMENSLTSSAPPTMGQPPSQWYQHPAVVSIVMVVFFPVGLILLWIHPTWQRKTKIIVSCIVGFICLTSVIPKPNPEELGQRDNEWQHQQGWSEEERRDFEESFNDIRPGMLESIVIRLLGTPTKISSGTHLTLYGQVGSLYVWSDGGAPPVTFNIVFVDGRVHLYFKTDK